MQKERHLSHIQHEDVSGGVSSAGVNLHRTEWESPWKVGVGHRTRTVISPHQNVTFR
jgi:hypothetical protein